MADLAADGLHPTADGYQKILDAFVASYEAGEMSISALSVFEVRAAGGGSTDDNGGGFVTGATGTDFSQQETAQVAFDGVTITGTTAGVAALITITGASPAASWIGNLINITGGLNFTPGAYQISSTASGTVTVDRNCATAAASGMTGGMGGALASPGGAGKLATVAGNKIWVKAGTYTVTSATANTNAGCVTLPGHTGSNTCFLQGYQTTRGDMGTKPVIISDGTITTFTLIGGAAWVINVQLDGNSRTASKGMATNGAIAYRCVFKNFVGGAMQGNSTSWAIESLFTGCTTVSPANSGNLINCRLTANTIAPWSSPSGGLAVGCIFDGNTGTTDSASYSANTILLNCTSFNNGRDNYRLLGAAGTIAGVMAINCSAFGTNGTSMNLNGVAANASFPHIVNCAADTYATNTTSLNKIGSFTLMGNPFTASSTGDFSLDATTNEGALCRNAGTPATYQGGSTTTSLDIGAAQHADPTQPAAANVLTGVSYNDGAMTGTLTLAAAGQLLTGNTVGVGGTSVVGTATLPTASHVLNDQTYGVSGNGSTGTLTLPSNASVLTTQTYGIAGNGSTGTATLPSNSSVLNTQTYGVAGNGSTGTATLPSNSSVLNTQTYGVAGNGSTGTATLPSNSSVLNTQTYGVAGNGSTGTATLPTGTNVRTAIPYGVAGNGSTGNVVLPSVGDVRSGTQYGANGTESTGTLDSGGGNTYGQTAFFG